MRSWRTSARASWPRVTDANPSTVAELVALGIERHEARWLLEEFDSPLDPTHRALLAALERRLAGEPLQYIIGHWPFRSLELDVDARVLIPRPETEELVDVALGALAESVNPPDVARAARAPLILDLGCGSGALGLALLDELRSRGVLASLIALDESLDALDVARANARKHALTAVSFVRSSWFDELDPSLRGRVDLIVANPPYVGDAEMASLDPVLDHEPRGALVSPDAQGVVGFGDLEAIVVGAREWLRPGGALVLEHGEAHRDALVSLARSQGYVGVVDEDDASGRPRKFLARWPS